MNNVRAHVDSGRFHAVYVIERRSALLAWLQSAGRVEVAAALLAEGESVVLDSGTTALEVARCLTDRRVTVMPLSLPAAWLLASREGVRLLMPCGDVRPGELSLVGCGVAVLPV
jgi:hypothetical protein